MTMDASTIVERCLSAFLAGPDSELKAIASEHQALPVYSDMGGTLFLTSALDVLTLDHNGGAAPKPETSEKWRLIAVVSGAERYPELQCLIPARPPDALQCSACAGTGRLALSNARCGECCGLGWRALHSNNIFETTR
jgi:hypothetical protein